jgi:hypothetical protein
LRGIGDKAINGVAFPAYGSSICQHIECPPFWFPSWTAPAVDENTDGDSSGGIMTHHDIGVVVLIKIGIFMPAVYSPPKLERVSWQFVSLQQIAELNQI